MEKEEMRYEKMLCGVENIAFVQAQTGAAEAAPSLAYKGTFRRICKEGKESGFEILLDNGLRAEVFSTAADVLAGRIVNLEEEIDDAHPLAVHKSLQSYRGERCEGILSR